jgi:acyl-CoA synthetase (AMP-forming)/AMP-acid ligase II
MHDAYLLPDLVRLSAQRTPDAVALSHGDQHTRYGELAQAIDAYAGGLVRLGLLRGERVAIYLEKRIETVVASFGTAAAGAVFVPLNPMLKPDQVGYILRDCGVRVLVTSPDRAALLAPVLAALNKAAVDIANNTARLLHGLENGMAAVVAGGWEGGERAGKVGAGRWKGGRARVWW